MFNSIRKVLAGVAALAALALGGAALAGAASSSNSSSSGSSTAGAPAAASSKTPPAGMPAPGTATHEDAETPVTGEKATKAQAAAVKAVGSGTAGAVTTDFTKDGYETTVTKSDGSKVEVHLDSSFNVMQGPGGHGAAGPPGAPPGGAAFGHGTAGPQGAPPEGAA
jgi:hypothetical protein